MDKLLLVSLEGAVLAGIVFLIKALGGKRLSKSFLYYIWLPVLLRLLIPVGFEVGVIPNSAPEATPYTVIETYDIPVIITEVPAEVEAAPVEKSFDWHSLIVPAYAAVAAGFFLYHVAAYFVFLRRLKRGLEYVQMSGRLKVYLSKAAETPMQVGVLRPMIVLPKRHYEREELDLILAHETVHWRRRDLVIKWLMLAVRSLHWFNPAVYFISRDLDRSCEMSCDEAVCRSLDEVGRVRYGETLIYMASAARLPVRVPAATLVENKKSLKERIIAIRDYKKVTILAVCAMAVLALTLCACSALIPGEKQDDENDVVEEPVVVELAEVTDESESAAVAALKEHLLMRAHNGTNAVVEYEVLGSREGEDGTEYLIVYMLSEYSPYSGVYIYGDAKAAMVTGSGRTAYIEFFDTRDELADILSDVKLDENHKTAADYRDELKERANADLSTENAEWYAPDNYGLTNPSEDYKRIGELTDEQVLVMYLNCYDSYGTKASDELIRRWLENSDRIIWLVNALGSKPYRSGTVSDMLEYLTFPDHDTMVAASLKEYNLSSGSSFSSVDELYRAALSDSSAVFESLHTLEEKYKRAANNLLASLITKDLEARPSGAFGGALYNEFLQFSDEVADMYLTVAIGNITSRITASVKYEEEFPADGVRVTYNPEGNLLTVINKDGSVFAREIILDENLFIAYNGKQAGVFNQDHQLREITIRKNETIILTAESDSASSDGEFSWSSSDDSILTVDDGKITGVAKGQAVLTVRSGYLSDSILVRVAE